MTCPNCDDCCRVPFDDPTGLTRYVACWLCDRGQRTMGIGQHFYGADLRRNPTAAQHLLAWQGLPPGWYLHGDVGRGKTYLASAICRHQASRGRTARFLSSARLLELIKATFDSNPADVREAAQYTLGRFSEADVVVLDDLGAEHDTAWAEAEMERWINGFYEREAALVVTSNFDYEQISDRLGRRIASRLIGMTLPLKLTGPDRREAGVPRPRPAAAAVVSPEPSAAEYAAIAARWRPRLQAAVSTLAERMSPGARNARRAQSAVAVPRADAPLKPEYRAEIEARIRAGQEDGIPPQWRGHVEAIRAAMESDG